MGLGWHTQRKLADKSAVSIPAARFFIDVDGVGGRVLRKSVRRAADVSRCPSTPVPPNFSKMSRKHHTRFLEGLTQGPSGKERPTMGRAAGVGAGEMKLLGSG